MPPPQPSDPAEEDSATTPAGGSSEEGHEGGDSGRGGGGGKTESFPAPGNVDNVGFRGLPPGAPIAPPAVPCPSVARLEAADAHEEGALTRVKALLSRRRAAIERVQSLC